MIAFLRKQLDRRGRQAYIVYPLVDDSDKVAAKSATAEFEKWEPLLAPHPAGLLHGRMPPREKEETVAKFGPEKSPRLSRRRSLRWASMSLMQTS